MIFLDTETVGLCGPAIIIQYAVDDGPIHIHNFWTETVGDSMKLIRMICDNECVVGFNLAFDWFQIAKMWTMLALYRNKYGSATHYPEEHIAKFAALEADARFGDCVKPRSALDLMLVARKTKYQITMNRGDIRIRKVPTVLATHLARELEQQIVLQNILFARRKDKYAPKWRVMGRTRRVGSQEVDDPQFKDVILKFKPSVALKALAIDALGVADDSVLKFTDIEVDKAYLPNEIQWAPFAQAVKDFKFPKKKTTNKLVLRIQKYRNSPWRWAWPDVIHRHIGHWQTYEPARLYANKDVEYTRALFKFFDCPKHGDDDSVLACMVGAVRWKGFSVDIPGLIKLKEEARAKVKRTPQAAKQVRAYLEQVLSPSECEMLREGTGKVILEDLAKRKNQTCPLCSMLGDNQVDPECSCCNGTNLYTHPVADRAQEVLDARFATKEIELYEKLLLAGRFHASFKIIGALSSRMSGADGLNAQGVKRDLDVRRNFTFSDVDTSLVGGDFDAFEVGIAQAAYQDPALYDALTTKATCPGCLGSGKKKGKVCKDCKGEGKAGQKIHGLFGMAIRPGMTYEQVVASKGSKDDVYDLGKRGVFSQIYMGNYKTLMDRLGCTEEVAVRAEREFKLRYPGMARAQQEMIDRFSSMKQPGGLGTKVEWHEPDEVVYSLLKFPRYFTLENMICKSLFNLANNPPKTWKALGSKIKLTRRDREQSASGATASALYSAAFQLQAGNTRAAGNHVIQSTGATITKHTQRRIWDIQPAGVSPWIVQCINVHDEILSVIDPKYKETVAQAVHDAVESFRSTVPLIKMEWKDMTTWADK